jgi:4-diphosphocytidyl-2-C-methyl-D-erythritol kinase
MQPLTCKSFAKLNLCLHIIDKRKDGYHNLESIFCIIDFYDILSFRKNNSARVNFKTNSNEIDSTYNLVTKAYNIISNLYDIEGIDIFLDKKIPIGSGLGGGSSNAAVTLLALNDIFKLNISEDTLMKISEEIGSDVPFFIKGGAAYIGGKGEIINSISIDKKYFVLILPNLNISTKDIYESLSPKDFMSQLSHHELMTSNFNSFEEIVMSKYPSLKETKYWLSAFGSVRMSGTGSTLYIEYDNYEGALEASKEIGQKYKSLMVSSLESYDIFS